MKPNHIYLIYMYKEDLALNNQQWLICHKTQPNQRSYILIYMYKQDLALNNIQWLICHKTQPKPNHIYLVYMYKQDLASNNLLGLICHKTKPYIYIYYIYISSCRAASTDIPDPSLATFSLSFIASRRSSKLHPVSSHSCCM